jgi:hypothetical protein
LRGNLGAKVIISVKEISRGRTSLICVASYNLTTSQKYLYNLKLS